MTDRREIIESYISRGWIPFAYKSPTHPPVGWDKSVITDNTVRECSESEFPVGLLLGAGTGLVAVDIDVQNGGSVEAFLERYGGDWRTLTVGTPSGGVHFLFEYPKDVDYLPKRINAGKWIDGMTGIDLLADGHHIVAPPTQRIGIPGKRDGEYRVIGDYPVAAMPPKLLADWLESCVSRPGPQGESVDSIPKADYGWVLDLHKAKVQEASTSAIGERDTTVYRCICLSVRIASYLPDDVLSIDQVEVDYAAAFAANQHGEEIRDLSGKLERALALAQQNPWVVSKEEKDELPAGLCEEDRKNYDNLVHQNLIKKYAGEKASHLYQEAKNADVEIVPLLNLDQMERRVSSQPAFLVKGLLAPAQSIMAVAQKKAGKTMLALNWVYSMTTGTPFLGRYEPVRPFKLAYFDSELGEANAFAYMDTLGIPRDMVLYCDLKGQARLFDTRSDHLRNKYAKALRDWGAEMIVVDCVGPIISAIGIDEQSSMVRPLLDSFDTLSRSAGCVAGPLVVHHAGHNESERGRGSSAFGDWPSMEWNLQRLGYGPEAPREFAIQSNRALGGATHSATPLEFDPRTLRVWYGGARKPSHPKWDLFDQTVGALGISSITTVKELKSAVEVKDETIKRWCDTDQRLRVVCEGSPGVARTWKRVEGIDPFNP